MNETSPSARLGLYERLVGRHYTDLDDFVRDDSVAAFREHVEAVVAGDTSERRVEIPARSPVEGDVIVEARVTGFDSPGSRGTALVLRDLTETIGTAEALALKSEQLAVVNAVLRHDVRNDMNVVLGWIERLRHGVATDEDHEIVDRVPRYGSRVVELTDTARTLVDAIEEGWELDRRPVDVRSTLVREVDLVREQFPGAEVELPDPVPAVAVRADGFLGSVVSNLLRNAVWHNDARTSQVDVTVGTAAETVRIAVADNEPRGIVVTVELERAD